MFHGCPKCRVIIPFVARCMSKLIFIFRAWKLTIFCWSRYWSRYWFLPFHHWILSSLLCSAWNVVFIFFTPYPTVCHLIPYIFVDSLAAIARKRPLHYSTILTALLDFNPNFELGKGCHASSILFSLRTALLGFLRSTNPAIMEVKMLFILLFFMLVWWVWFW